MNLIIRFIGARMENKTVVKFDHFTIHYKILSDIVSFSSGLESSYCKNFSRAVAEIVVCEINRILHRKTIKLV